MWQKKIPSEINFEFTRSRGVGGQHVNRTESAAVLRWMPQYSHLFSEIEKARIQKNLANKMTLEGEILIRSESHRERDRNIKDGIQKLIQLLEKALFVPKVRKKTKPTYSSTRKRLDSKKVHSEKKQSRQKINRD